MREQQFPGLSVLARGKRESGFSGAEVGWKRESGWCRVSGCGSDGHCGWTLGDGRGRIGPFEGGEKEAAWKDVFERIERRVRTCGMCMQMLQSNSRPCN